MDTKGKSLMVIAINPIAIVITGHFRSCRKGCSAFQSLLWMPKEPLRGDKLEGWADFRKKGMYNTQKYSFKRGWGGKFNTATKKFEFYSETAKKGLAEHAVKFQTTIDASGNWFDHIVGRANC